jgi:hypothetical protein
MSDDSPTTGRGHTPGPATDGTFRIFINYRRADTSGHAGRLWDALVERFGDERVFIDIDTIRPGVDFAEVISEAVGRSDVVIALIGRQWLTSADSKGRRRLDDPDDFVRLELETALKRNARVIPTLVQGTEMPGPDELPDELRALARRNALELSDVRWRYDVQRMVKTLEQIENELADLTRLEAEQALSKQQASERAAQEAIAQTERERTDREAQARVERETAARAERETAERAARARAEEARLEREATKRAERERAEREKAERQRRRATAPRTDREPRRRLLGPAAATVAILAIVAAVAGFFSGRATSSEKHAAPSPSPSASLASARAGAVALRFPTTWRRVAQEPGIPGVGFGTPLLLAPAGHVGDAGLVVGTTAASSPTYLPKPLLGLVDADTVQRREIVRLGAFEAFRYRNLRPVGFGRTLVLYPVPVNDTTTVACFATPSLERAFLPVCEGIAATIRIRGASPVSLLPSRRYAAFLNGVLGKLNTRRQEGLHSLRTAKTRRLQAGAAGEIARAYAGAAGRVARAPVTPLVREANSAIAAATSRVGAAYRRLASAARRGRTHPYQAASRLILGGESRLRNALSSLAAYGYSTR